MVPAKSAAPTDTSRLMALLWQTGGECAIHRGAAGDHLCVMLDRKGGTRYVIL